MCGIAGVHAWAAHDPVDATVVRAMLDTIVHRGPDDGGIHADEGLAIGARRLSIIDLAGGHQPMADAEETTWVIFNGEIYNYPELRAELQSHGHQFRTRSDTEVIVHGYKQWGDEVLNRLNGMFGLAIWDTASQRLLVARDAMGIKPLYYQITNGQLTFGSEIRAVFAGTESAPEVDPVALNLFLRFRYTPAPYTIHRGIRKLAPGAMLIAESGACREQRWYNYTPVPFGSAKEDNEATEELLQLYKAAVRRHLLSDVPVGILLSGGLDSGLLLALMNEHGESWPAYTIGYGETFQDDELADAAETARLLGARHIPVQLDRSEFERSLPKIIGSLEEPIASSSVVPMYFVSQRARQDVKVVMIGQGPDELFGGYKRHIGVHYGQVWRGLPGFVRSAATAAVNRLPRNETLKRGVHSLGVADPLQRFENVFSLAPAETIDGLFQDGLLPPDNGYHSVELWREILPQATQTDELNSFQMIELRSSLPDELLMFADKLSMAHSLEGRVPYLDRTVVEFGQRLGARHKVRNGTGKWIHRRVCEKFLPAQILKRKKRGFAVNVVDGWFDASLNSKLPEMLRDRDSLMFNILKPDAVRALLDAHQSRRADNHKLLFSLVMFEQWLRVTESAAARHEPAGVH